MNIALWERWGGMTEGFVVEPRCPLGASDVLNDCFRLLYMTATSLGDHLHPISTYHLRLVSLILSTTSP